VKKNGNLIILGDWNAVVGEGQEGEAVGKCGLGEITEDKDLLTLHRKGNYNYKHHHSTTSETPIHVGKAR
jgi:hypothetical protein